MQSRIDNTPDPIATLQAFNDRQPMGRMGKPSEIAQAIVFAADDEAAFMNGQDLHIDGGALI